jgi:hypothetical protein
MLTSFVAFSRSNSVNLEGRNLRTTIRVLLMTAATMMALAPSAHAGEGGALAAGLLGGLAAGTFTPSECSNLIKANFQTLLSRPKREPST